ncbi:MAG TPA: VWA domain-containing protein [Dongiaceae bacterium]|nr:VWA domain-containing protein [Dongiaceae bacterium]
MAQVLTIPTSTNRFGSAVALDAIQSAQMDFNYFTINTQNGTTSPLQTPSGSVSMLDLKAPGKAQKEYQKGYQLLLRKDIDAAIEHLARATAIYPKYVAAHNALGTAYLDVKQNEKAEAEFSQAASLDEHMPNTYLNLGCAQLALTKNAAAEESFRKASALAPLDSQVQLALAYGEFTNKDYPAVIATAQQVHSRKHAGAALVHFFAGAALAAQNDLPSAQTEMKLLLREDPKSPSAEEFRKILASLQDEQHQRAQLKFPSVQKITYSIGIPTGPNPEVVNRMAQQAVEGLSQREQIEEAENAPEPGCTECGTAAGDNSESTPTTSSRMPAGPVFRATVDEVSMLFAVTDHGKSVTDLASSDIQIRDDLLSPDALLNFRNEKDLPLRLGLVIDTSNSVTDRFRFEQGAAIKFLETVLTGPDDQAFVVGVNNSVLLVQDFTSDHAHMARAIGELAPSGGTALWDAVNFAAEKLANRIETKPVARVIVVISDGSDNSSSLTLKDVIASALHREVAVYTVSTRDALNQQESAVLGDRALQTISELTGGAAYRPGSASKLNGSFSELQQVIRSRYLISYRPASFQRDGRYRLVDITAEKNGHKLRVYTRRGYYASAAQPQATP